MAVPLTWRDPAAGGKTSTDPTSGYTQLSYGNGYWFAITRNTTASGDYKPILRYATDPTGTWTEATLPSPPAGFASNSYAPTRVVYGNGYYAFAVFYESTTTSPYRAMRVLYASSPGGTWSQYQYDATEAHWPQDMLYDGTRFVVVGRKFAASDIGFIANATTPGGTWTFNTSSATTGYITAAQVNSIDFDGTTYVTTAYSTATPPAPLMRYSTALTSGWATPSTSPTTPDIARVRYQSNGYWTAFSGGTEYDERIWRTTTASGTWSALLPNISGATNLRFVGDVFYYDGVWVIAGQQMPASAPVPAMYYLQATGNPSGTWTEITGLGFDAAPGPGLVGNDLTAVYARDGVWVAGSFYYGQVRFSPLAAAPTYLRQRQSPLSTPSRVRGVDLRQRQTPRITRP